MKNPETYIGTIKIFGFGNVPEGWAACNGQLLPISQNTALYALIGTMYGGDGKTTFALPDFRRCLPIHWGGQPGGSTYVCGQRNAEPVRLREVNLPPHTHSVRCTDHHGYTDGPKDAVWTTVYPDSMGAYASKGELVRMGPHASGFAGSSDMHQNHMPGLILNFCIALEGVFPPRA